MYNSRNHDTNIMLGNYFFPYRICDWYYDSRKFEAITERESNVFCWRLDSKNFMSINYSRDRVNYYKANEFINNDLTQNNFIQTNKLNTQTNRENSEFKLFTEIVLKVCEKNKSWLSNCLFTSNPNCKRHVIN